MKHQSMPKNEMKVTVTFSETEKTSARLHHGEIPTVIVATIRGRTGLSQSAFTASIAVPVGTLTNWE